MHPEHNHSPPQPLTQAPVQISSSGASGRRHVQRLLRFVRLSSERARHAVRQDCSSAKKQEAPSALLVVVVAVGKSPVRHV
jgi:hypothetical protein